LIIKCSAREKLAHVENAADDADNFCDAWKSGKCKSTLECMRDLKTHISNAKQVRLKITSVLFLISGLSLHKT
jgi:hypothetical protein